MNYSKLISDEFDKKQINLTIDEIPLNIFLKSGDIIKLCFIERETIDTLVVYETTTRILEGDVLLGDELRILPKESIEYVALVYDLDLLDVDIDVKDKMFL